MLANIERIPVKEEMQGETKVHVSLFVGGAMQAEFELYVPLFDCIRERLGSFTHESHVKFSANQG